MNFALGRENYKLMAIGFVIIVAGFLLMLGGRRTIRMYSVKNIQLQKNNIGPDCCSCRIRLEIWAIMKKPSDPDK